MTLQVLKIHEHKPDYTGTSRSTGKPYTIKRVYASIKVDGAQFDGTVKSFGTEEIIKEGSEYTQVEVNEFNGSKEYAVSMPWPKKDGATGGGWKGGKGSAEKTKWGDFCQRVNLCWSLAGNLSKDKQAEVFDSLLKNSWTVDIATMPTDDVVKKAKDILGGKGNDEVPF